MHDDGGFETRDSDPVFEAMIRPHRSLSRRGVQALGAVVTLATSLIALRVWLIGGWPVLAFSVPEVMLAIGLLALNARRARARECITLSPIRITVVQTDHRGRRRSFSLPSAWLQVRLDSADNRASRLLISSRGQGREVGSFLHEAEKRSLFEALRTALDGLRQPRSDNESLRAG
jgi:uncharacterized membrane protein